MGHLSHLTMLAELVSVFLGILGGASHPPIPVRPSLSPVFSNTQVRGLFILLVVETCSARYHAHWKRVSPWGLFWSVTFEKEQATSPRKKALDTLQDFISSFPLLP